MTTMPTSCLGLGAHIASRRMNRRSTQQPGHPSPPFTFPKILTSPHPTRAHPPGFILPKILRSRPGPPRAPLAIPCQPRAPGSHPAPGSTPCIRHQRDSDRIPTQYRQPPIPQRKIINATFQRLRRSPRKTRDSPDFGLPPINHPCAIHGLASRRGHGCPGRLILPLTPHSHPPRKMIGCRGYASCAHAGSAQRPSCG